MSATQSLHGETVSVSRQSGRIHSETCHERTPSGHGKGVRTRQVAPRQKDRVGGWGGAKHMVTLHSAQIHCASPPETSILNTRPEKILCKTTQTLSSTHTILFNVHVSQLSVLHVFHKGPAGGIQLGHEGIDPCNLRFPARQRVLYTI